MSILFSTWYCRNAHMLGPETGTPPITKVMHRTALPQNWFKRHKLGDLHSASLSNYYLNWRSWISETRSLK